MNEEKKEHGILPGRSRLMIPRTSHDLFADNNIYLNSNVKNILLVYLPILCILMLHTVE